MPKKVTLKDIAAKAGLSPASVSMILNRRSIDRFNAETVEQVYAIAAELGYKSSKEKAYALVRPSDTLIIIICPSLFNPFYTTIIQGIEIVARKQGFVTSVRTTYWDTDTEKFIMEQARKFNVAGVIFAMIPQQPQLAYKLSKYLPVVAIGDRRSDLELATVDMNNFTAVDKFIIYTEIADGRTVDLYSRFIYTFNLGTDLRDCLKENIDISYIRQILN